jgi:DNA polymerase III epsilon subunit-like protein
MNFAAIDVETANPKRSSICQVGLTIVQAGQMSSHSWLINPLCDFSAFNSEIHKIKSHHVVNAPTIAGIWQDLRRLIGRRPLFSHSDFDRQAMTAAADLHGLVLPNWEWHDSIDVARETWPDLKSYKLKSLITKLGLPAGQHHDASYDAATVALIVKQAIAKGYSIARR